MSLPNINHVTKKTSSQLKLAWDEIQYILCLLFVHICRFENCNSSLKFRCIQLDFGWYLQVFQISLCDMNVVQDLAREI